MHISTSTNIHQLSGADSIYRAAESIHMIKAAGFEAVDISMHTASLPKGELATDAEAWVASVEQALAITGLKPTQAHAIFRPGSLTYTAELNEFFRRMTFSNIAIAGRLGIPWVVMHPLHGQDTAGLKHKHIMEKNRDWFLQIADCAAKYHVGIAIENMFPDQFTTADDLLELLDLLNNDIFGICWDTGHANIMKQDSPASFRKLGSHLKATHIADNRGIHDEHLLPYLGNIPWKEVSKSLYEIDYKGDFTYEIQEMNRYMPLYFHAKTMAFAYQVAKEILGHN